MAEAIRWDGNDLLLCVRVQPRASRDGFAGRHGEAWRIRLTAPPVEGRANAALIAFLAEAFGVPLRRIILQQWETGRMKILRICDPARLPAELDIPGRPPKPQS